jgi:proteasome assembly chaperone 3
MPFPTLPSEVQNMQINDGVEHTPFPAAYKQAAGLVNGTQTNVSSLYFADKILITISQGGRLGQWACSLHAEKLYQNADVSTQIQVPLSSASPTSFDTALPSDGGDMLPLGHLTPKTLLGAGSEQRETMGHLYASQIASTIATKNPEETRTVLVGFGLEKVELERETFFDMLELVQKVL